MGKNQYSYPPKYRARMVELVRAGRAPEELGRLRRENRQLKREREILAKATVWFAREIGSVPGKSSSS